MAIRLNDSIRTKLVDNVSGYFGTGMLRVYDGVQPSSGGGSTAGVTLLVQIDGILWGSGSNGTANLSTSYAGTAIAVGDASWARLSGTNGTGDVVDGGCGTASTCDFVIDKVSLTGTSVVTLTGATLIQPGE